MHNNNNLHSQDSSLFRGQRPNPCRLPPGERVNLWSSRGARYLVQDDPKLPDDSGKILKPNGVVGGSIPDRAILSLLDI
jgi:hypothetical protein